MKQTQLREYTDLSQIDGKIIGKLQRKPLSNDFIFQQ